MLFYVLNIFSVAIFGLILAGESELSLTACKRNSNDYSACLKRTLKKTWPLLIKGLPEFDFPPLDPLIYKYGKIVFHSGELRAEVIFSNVTVIGLSKARFSDVRTHFLEDVFRVEVDVLVPTVFLKSAVKVNGTLNVFRVAGEGHLNVTAIDIGGTYDLIGHVMNDTLIVEHFHLAPSLGKLKIYFDNLFDINKELNNFVLTFVNEYWPAIYRVILPTMTDILDPWLTNFVNKFFSKVPFSEVFL